MEASKVNNKTIDISIEVNTSGSAWLTQLSRIVVDPRDLFQTDIQWGAYGVVKLVTSVVVM